MIPDHIRANFRTLMRAAENGDLALDKSARTPNPARRVTSYAPSAVTVASTSSCPWAIWRRGIPTRRTTRQSESRPG